jgi:hypothetical protein
MHFVSFTEHALFLDKVRTALGRTPYPKSSRQEGRGENRQLSKSSGDHVSWRGNTGSRSK